MAVSASAEELYHTLLKLWPGKTAELRNWEGLINRKGKNNATFY